MDDEDKKLQKQAFLQSRLAKSKSKQKRLNACPESKAPNLVKTKKKRSSIFDINKKANQFKSSKKSKVKGKVKGGVVKGPKGKAFGKPQKKKSKF